MKLQELKKLSNKELIERFPYIQLRTYQGDLAYYTKEDLEPEWYTEKEIKELVGQPLLVCSRDYGWFDILLLYAEKIKPIYDAADEKTKKGFYIDEFKEKYGSLRLYTTYGFGDIDKYTNMAEHLSYITCACCGKITKTSDGKKAISYRYGSYGDCYCKKCSKRIAKIHAKNYIKEIEVYKNKYGNKWHKMYWKKLYKKNIEDFTFIVTRFGKDGNIKTKYDCRELF